MNKILVLSLMTLIAGAANAQSTATTPLATKPVAKLTTPATSSAELAKAVAALMPLEQQVTEFTQTAAQNLPEAKRPLFMSIMKKNVDIAVLRNAATSALVQTYTPQELQTMKDMYSKPGSPEIIAKMDKFSEIMQPTVQAMVTKGVEESRKAGLVP